MKRTTAYFPNILPVSYDYDASDKGYSHKKAAVRELPFTDDKLKELFDAGADFERLADAYDNNAFKRSVALAVGKEWAESHPVEPLRPRLRELVIADKLQSHTGHCPESWLPGVGTGDGLGYGKELVCGREWCPVCGKNGSTAHKRRMFSQHKRKSGKVGLSWYDKLSQLKSAGYWVVEFPLRYRYAHHTKQQLEADGKLITSVLKGDYEIEQLRDNFGIVTNDECAFIHSEWFSEGLRRWHYFNDMPEGALPEDVKSMVFNPHLNVLTNSGFIKKPEEEYIKGILRDAFDCPDLIVHYSYAGSPSRIVHLLSYVTRATFLNLEWDKFLAGSLYGFRNMRSWGKWDAAPVWTLADLDAVAKEIIAGVDIDAIRRIGKGLDTTGKPIIWSRPVPIGLLHYIKEHYHDDFIDYGAGFCSFKLPMPDKTVFESAEMCWQLQLNKVMAAARAVDRCKESLPLSTLEMSLDKTQPGQNKGVCIDSSASVSQKAEQMDLFSAGETNSPGGG